MPPRARKTAAAKQPQDRLAPRTASIVPPIETDLVEITTTDADEIEMVTVFTIDGRAYQMQAEPSATVALSVLEKMNEVGEISAIPFTLRAGLGDEAVEALYKVPNLSGVALTRIVELVTARITGVMDLGN